MTEANEVNDSRTEVAIGRLGDFLGFRLRRLQNRLSRDFATATKSYNLRSGLMSSLEIIRANPGISQQDLSDAVALDKSVIVLIIDLLEERGLAERRKSGNDRRRYSLFITEAGEAHLGELFAIMTQTEDRVLHGIALDEMRRLMTILDRLYANLQDSEGESTADIVETKDS
ncbi:MAG: MarR family winged helix-turn-helix transcriptional regulator [Allosphingosinicella sp.]